jgi:hypothetical protein
MSDTQPPADALLFQPMVGFIMSRSIFAVAELGVADQLRDHPLSSADPARQFRGNRQTGDHG